MVKVKRLKLDVLKPHQPDGLEFSHAIAERGDDYRVNYNVIEVDDKTQTVVLTIEGDDIQFDAIRLAITEMGATLHSIDEVNVESSPEEVE
jgi:hypothetical protein